MSGRYSGSSVAPAAAPVVLNERYELGEIIAEGGQAQVRLGRDVRLKREVAVKILRAQFAASPEFLDRFHREAELTAQYSHPNLVNVYDVGQDGGLHYIVMELLPGRTVKDLVTRGPLALEEAVDLTRQVAIGMAFAHLKGLVHRDLKPQNVLLTEAGHPKVADFGLALMGESAQLTQPGTVWGTVQYLSPEQAQGLPADARSDIYSLGALFYELLTGNPPFEGSTPASIMMKHVYDPAPDASEANHSVPVAAARVAQRAMAKAPHDRFQTMDDLAQALLDVRDSAAAETAVWGSIPKRSRRPVSGPSESATRVFTPPAAAPGQRGRRGVPSTQPAGGATPDRRASVTGARRQQPRRASRRMPLILAGAVLLFFGLMAVGATVASRLFSTQTITRPDPTRTTAATPVATNTPAPTPTPAPVMIAVPNAIGVPLATAQARLTAANLGSELAGEEFSREVPRGSVTNQEPEANARLEQGKPVRLSVSKGPESVAVPAVSGKGYDAARAELVNAGFTVKRENAFSARPSDVVIEQRPAGSTQAAPGADVVLIVSQGPREVPMPRLREMPLADALARLRALGLDADVREVPDPLPPGLVANTVPDAGGTALRDRKVIVAVSAARQVESTSIPATATRPSAPLPPATATPARPAATTQSNPGGQQPPGQQGR